MRYRYKDRSIPVCYEDIREVQSEVDLNGAAIRHSGGKKIEVCQSGESETSVHAVWVDGDLASSGQYLYEQIEAFLRLCKRAEGNQ